MNTNKAIIEFGDSEHHPFEDNFRALIAHIQKFEFDPPITKLTVTLVPDLDQIARTVHEVNRVYSQSIGDNSLPPWEEYSDFLRAPIYAGIKAVMATPDMAPGTSHNNWMKEKIAQGWVYGPVKDPDAKPPTHPLLIHYEQMKESDKVKDKMFLAVVKSFL